MHGDGAVVGSRSIFPRLKAETADLHERVERAVPVLAVRSLADYRDLLERFAALYARIETRVHCCEGLASVVPDVRARIKLPHLERDLQQLGVVRRLVGPAHVPAIRSVAAALGALYVLEGATLGGQIIARQLRRELGSAVEPCIAFFSGYGERTGPMWKRFRADTDRFLARLAEPERAAAEVEIVAAARETFLVFESWFGAPSASVTNDERTAESR